METQRDNPLPKMLPGAVCAQWIRCGKPRCICARGTLHGPYFYRFWREHGRLRKAYVTACNVSAVRAACAEERRFRRLGRLVRDTGKQEWQRLMRLLREIERDA